MKLGPDTIIGAINLQSPTSNYLLKVYPNPNTGEFVIEMDISKPQDIQLTIFNILGQSVYTVRLGHVRGVISKQINMKVSTTGVYYLQMISGKEIINRMIVLE